VPARPTGKGAPFHHDGHNGSVKLRIGTAVAFGAGYVLGTRAGRERYLQIVGAVGQLSRSAPVTGTTTLVTEKSKAVAALGVERMKDTIGVRLGWRNGDQAADAIALDLAEDLATALSSRRFQPERRPSATAAARGPLEG
jgi:hypothetical protein